MIIYIVGGSQDDFLAQLDRLSRIKKLGIKSVTTTVQNYTVLIHCDFSLSGKDLGIDWGVRPDPNDVNKRYQEFIDAEMTTAGFKRYSEDSKLWIVK